MLGLYLVCALVGGALMLLSLLGLAGEHGLEHPGLDHPGDAAHPDHAGGLAPGLTSWLSVRALVAFAAFFGLGGLAGRALGLGGAATLAFALAAGLAVGLFAAWLFRLARLRGETGTTLGRMVGRTGRLLVAPRGAVPGKVALLTAGQREDWPASSSEALSAGETVIVIAQAGGIVEVRRWQEAEVRRWERE